VDQMVWSHQPGPAVDWQHLSGQLSVAGFGHLSVLDAGGEATAVPKLPELFDALCKVRTRACVFADPVCTAS
jgi:MoaA/NifB/PqqE/SkfB family radical SAM enzyme